MEISYNQAAYILRYKQNHWFEKHCCNWALCKQNENAMTLYCHVKMWIYILLFIPNCLIHLGWCLWDGGLKEFCIDPVQVYAWNIVGFSKDDENTQFGRAKNIWEGKRIE